MGAFPSPFLKLLERAEALPEAAEVRTRSPAHAFVRFRTRFNLLIIFSLLSFRSLLDEFVLRFHALLCFAQAFHEIIDRLTFVLAFVVSTSISVCDALALFHPFSSPAYAVSCVSAVPAHHLFRPSVRLLRSNRAAAPLFEPRAQIVPVDQATVNEYRRGVGISPPVDTHSAFTGCLLSLSLAGPAAMEFRRSDRKKSLARSPDPLPPPAHAVRLEKFYGAPAGRVLWRAGRKISVARRPEEFCGAPGGIKLWLAGRKCFLSAGSHRAAPDAAAALAAGAV